jgi:hypothetical protein
MELPDDFGPDRLAGRDQVAEDPVDHVLVKNAQVPVSQEVFLQGLELEAPKSGSPVLGQIEVNSGTVIVIS